MNFYNENNSFAAAWLRELIKADIIAPGVVDERSIEDIVPRELERFTQCHFFAGIGVWSYALRATGWPDNVKVWTGSCPCQPFSAAGQRKGSADERHLWPTWFHLIQNAKGTGTPVFGEQVASKDAKTWLDLVQDDLEGIGHTVWPAITTACGFGASHVRKRIYFVADTECARLSRPEYDERVLGTAQEAFTKRGNEIIGAWRQLETSPTSLPSFDGAPLWLSREIIRCYGNALVAPQAQAFIESYMETRIKLSSNVEEIAA